MFKINVSGLKLMAETGAQIAIEFIPLNQTTGSHYMTVITLDTQYPEDRGLLITKLGKPRVFKNLNKAISEIQKIMPKLDRVSVMTWEAAKSVRISNP